MYSADHEIFRESVKRFIAVEIAPHHREWERAGAVPKALYKKGGEAGMLCPSFPEKYGAAGGDFLHCSIIYQELAYAGATGVQFGLHSDIVAPYILHYGSDNLRQQFLPGMVDGSIIGAIAMTEPGAGSDLRGMKTRAKRVGDEFVITGSKIFITNGTICDMVIVACKTGEGREDGAMSLIVVEANRAGFSRSNPQDKMGAKAQDTAEMYFDEVRVPVSNLVGREGEGFRYLVSQLPQERLLVALGGQAAAEAALDQTIDYVKNRDVFGAKLSTMQNTRFKIAEMATKVRVGRAFLNECLALHVEGRLDAETASMAKYFHTDMQCDVIDEGLQLFGGYGYMNDTPIARAYAGARVQKIYGGTNEIMKEIIARGLLGSQSGKRG
jgi:alkylation response protein AidB-like acyl-CoA dehydrogenase